jgi:hypothetical protein
LASRPLTTQPRQADPQLTHLEATHPVPVTHAPYEGARVVAGVPAYSDPRWAHPSYGAVAWYPGAPYRAPHTWWYRPYYAHWWCHPYWRYTWATTVVVGFPFATYAWVDTWAPPSRYGWAWVPGYWDFGWWHPGYWSPVAPAPVGYAYVPGWWDQQTYVEGYYRSEARDGWNWVDGYYQEDGTYVPGHWEPTSPAPDGYVWEPGLFDGTSWVDGFWRPEFRTGYTWVSSYFASDGIFHAGFWKPTEDRPGFVWVPGWFDGTSWNEGKWVTEAEYKAADPSDWKPEDAPPGAAPELQEQVQQAPKPLAIPVPDVQ